MISAVFKGFTKVNVQIEPFFKEFFKRLFVPVADKHESWQIKTLKTQKLRKTTITINDFYADLDSEFSNWRRVPVNLPLPGSPTGWLYDGYYSLDSDKPDTISYNETKKVLTIRSTSRNSYRFGSRLNALQFIQFTNKGCFRPSYIANGMQEHPPGKAISAFN